MKLFKRGSEILFLSKDRNGKLWLENNKILKVNNDSIEIRTTVSSDGRIELPYPSFHVIGRVKPGLPSTKKKALYSNNKKRSSIKISHIAGLFPEDELLRVSKRKAPFISPFDIKRGDIIAVVYGRHVFAGRIKRILSNKETPCFYISFPQGEEVVFFRDSRIIGLASRPFDEPIPFKRAIPLIRRWYRANIREQTSEDKLKDILLLNIPNGSPALKNKKLMFHPSPSIRAIVANKMNPADLPVFLRKSGKDVKITFVLAKRLPRKYLPDLWKKLDNDNLYDRAIILKRIESEKIPNLLEKVDSKFLLSKPGILKTVLERAPVDYVFSILESSKEEQSSIFDRGETPFVTVFRSGDVSLLTPLFYRLPDDKFDRIIPYVIENMKFHFTSQFFSAANILIPLSSFLNRLPDKFLKEKSTDLLKAFESWQDALKRRFPSKTVSSLFQTIFDIFVTRLTLLSFREGKMEDKTKTEIQKVSNRGKYPSFLKEFLEKNKNILSKEIDSITSKEIRSIVLTEYKRSENTENLFYVLLCVFCPDMIPMMMSWKVSSSSFLSGFLKSAINPKSLFYHDDYDTENPSEIESIFDKKISLKLRKQLERFRIIVQAFLDIYFPKKKSFTLYRGTSATEIKPLTKEFLANCNSISSWTSDKEIALSFAFSAQNFPEAGFLLSTKVSKEDIFFFDRIGGFKFGYTEDEFLIVSTKPRKVKIEEVVSS